MKEFWRYCNTLQLIEAAKVSIDSHFSRLVESAESSIELIRYLDHAGRARLGFKFDGLNNQKLVICQRFGSLPGR